MATKKEEKLILEPIKKTLITATLKGESDLILNKKARSFEMAELWKQSHPKGSKMPEELAQNYCIWEKLITSIDWRDPIEFHDDDWTKYTEEEWRSYMENNAPCINSQAIFGSMYEAFVSFGYKESTQKNGTDVKRGVSMTRHHFPIRFAEARYEHKLIPNNSKSHTNVAGQYNVFTGWECDIELVTADVAFPADTIIDLLFTTGEFIGISTQRHNNYGRFTVENIKKTDISGRGNKNNKLKED